MADVERVGFFNYELVSDIQSLDVRRGANSGCCVAVCLNTHSFVTALDDLEFRHALESADVVIPDGEGVCIACNRLKKRKVKKIAGDDLHKHLLRQVESICGKVYYMGSSEEVLGKIVRRIGTEYPNISVRTYSPPMCDELTREESMRIVADIEHFGPDVVFVSMTAPKQEKWICKYREYMSTPSVVAAIGAVFDFYAGTSKRAPQWLVKLKLEWLVRLVKEPKRMWRRVFVSTPRFVKYVWKNRKEI